MNKRGLSAVVTTVLVIAMSAILVALLGALVLNELKKTPDLKATAQSITIRLSVPAESLFVNQSQKQVSFLLQRKAGKGDMMGFIVVLDEGGNSKSYEQFKSVSLTELESKQFSFIHTQQGAITRFKLIPIIRTLKGEEYLSSSPIEYEIGPDGRPIGINQISRINNEQNTTQNNNTNNTQNSNYNPQNQTGLISYITFESSTWSNNKVSDIIAANNHLDIQGLVQQGQGIAGQGIHFTGNPTNVTFNNNELTNRGATDFSIIVWAKPEKYQATQMILAKGNVRPITYLPDGKGYGIAMTDGVSYGEISDGGSTTSSKIEIDRGGIRLNVWHQFALVRTDAQLAYYIDGRLIQTKTGNQVLNVDTSEVLSVGSRRCLGCSAGNNVGDYFIGTIDEIMLFNRSVNAQEVTNNYNYFNRGANTPATCNVESFKTLWAVYGPPQIINGTWKDTHVQPFYPIIEHRTEMSHYIVAPGNSYGNYLPGGFEPTYPHISSTGAMIAGGVPQRANIEASKQQIRNWLTNSNSWYYIPSGYNGYIFLDYEEWPLVWNQLNYTDPRAGTSPYIIESRNIVRSQHPDWNNAQIETEAERQWNEGARTFTIEMFRETKRLFPNAKVGFYGYPATPFYRGYMSEYGDRLRAENDQLGWLWSEVDYIAPAAYITGAGLQTNEYYEIYARQYLYSSILETKRIADQYGKPIIPFITYLGYNMNNFNYADDYLDDKNLKSECEIPFLMGANTVFIWGYETQVGPAVTPTTGRSIGGLTMLENYLETRMGPQLQTIKSNGCSPDQLL